DGVHRPQKQLAVRRGRWLESHPGLIRCSTPARPATASPPDHPCRYTNNRCSSLHTLQHHASSADHGIGSNAHTRDDDGASTNECAPFDENTSTNRGSRPDVHVISHLTIVIHRRLGVEENILS